MSGTSMIVLGIGFCIALYLLFVTPKGDDGRRDS